MEKRQALERAFILVIFVASILYYQCTQRLRIDREFYEASMSYMQKRAFLSRGPPLPYMLLAEFVRAIQALASKTPHTDTNELLLLSFNILGSAILTLNVAMTYLTLRAFSSPGNSVCGVILFYMSPLAAIKMPVLSPTLFTFTLFSLCICMLTRFVVHPSPRYALPLALALGMLLSSTWMACTLLLVFAARILIELYKSACDSRMHVLSSATAAGCALALFFLAVPFAVYLIAFYMYICSQRECPGDMRDLSIEYRASLEPFPEPCDRFVLDRALITILSKSTQSHVVLDTSVKGSRDKSPGAIWRVIKIHVETAPNYSPDSEESTFIQNDDIVKIVNLQTGECMGVEENSADSNAKFLKVVVHSRGDETNDNDLWRVISSSQFLEARQSLIRLRHVVSGRELGIKADGISVCVSHDSRMDLRYFYVEDAYNEEYYKRYYGDPRVRHKAVLFPQLGFWAKFVEINRKLYRMFTEKGFSWEAMNLTGNQDWSASTSAKETQTVHRMWSTYIFMLAVYPAALVLGDIIHAKLKRDLGFSVCSYFLCIQWMLTVTCCLFYGIDKVYFFYLAVFALVDVFSKVPFVLFAFTGASLAVLYSHYHSLAHNLSA